MQMYSFINSRQERYLRFVSGEFTTTRSELVNIQDSRNMKWKLSV